MATEVQSNTKTRKNNSLRYMYKPATPCQKSERQISTPGRAEQRYTIRSYSRTSG